MKKILQCQNLRSSQDADEGTRPHLALKLQILADTLGLQGFVYCVHDAVFYEQIGALVYQGPVPLVVVEGRIILIELGEILKVCLPDQFADIAEAF